MPKYSLPQTKSEQDDVCKAVTKTTAPTENFITSADHYTLNYID